MDKKTFLFIWTYYQGYKEVIEFEHGRPMPCLQITAHIMTSSGKGARKRTSLVNALR